MILFLYIIWSDEAKFTKNGVFNRRNSHYWSDYNVHPFRERNFQESWQFNAYCAIRNDGVLALEFYQDNLNANNGPHLWPPRSPDLSVLDFFIWGTIKIKVYNTALTTREDCMRRVRTAFQDLDPQLIRRATRENFLLRIFNTAIFVMAKSELLGSTRGCISSMICTLNS
ncbi:hypothetical protein NQ318_000874 [Aromia moschata]|uniref:Uncharacterized protein n=1 Tax=Aromia moschata TaxID=1265417 RepID=A0AAV8ZDL9_9CUCU|nr:hypothetical protein NQ318_000874 [Aromia moschata]